MFFFGRKTGSTGPTMSLQEAVSRGLVRVELRGVGDGVSSRVELRLTKLTAEPFTVVVSRGTEFAPVTRPVSGRA